MSSFLSTDNKAVIWQLLVDNEAFLNIPGNKFQMTQNIFENLFNEINNFQKSLPLIDKNKLVISEMMKKLEFIKTQKITPPLQEVKINMEKALENKQEEFIKLVKKPNQDEINFSDKNVNSDSPILNEEMDLMLNDMIQQRQSEFNLNNNDQSEKTSLQFSDQKESVPTPEKKVSFSETNLEFLNKIKKKESEDDIPLLLSKILNNQDLIMKDLNLLKIKLDN